MSLKTWLASSSNHYGDRVPTDEDLRYWTPHGDYEPPPPPPLTYERLTCADLANGDWRQQYFVRDVLAVGQHGIVAGRFKTLKTGIGVVDLGLSIATGTPFLGHFEVETPGRVGIFSGESGKAALQDWALRIARAKGIDLAAVDGLFWSTQLPQIGEMAHMDALERWITEAKLDLCIIDPSYLALSAVAGDAGNVFSVGKLLTQITELGNRINCTFLLVNHNNRARGRTFDPPDLMDVAWSGFAEWARQWICLGPRREWEPDTGQHWLWMTVGGSAGHAGLYGLDVTEGRRSDPGGRTWEVEVLSAEEARQGARQEKEIGKEAARQAKQAEAIADARDSILAAFRSFGHGQVVSEWAISQASGKRGKAFTEALGQLAREGLLKIHEGCKAANGKEFNGYSRNWGD